MTKQRQFLFGLTIVAALGTLYYIKHEEAHQILQSINKSVPPKEYQFIPECGCKREFLWPPSSISGKAYNSSCSDEGTFYYNKQQVLSFTMYIVNKTDTTGLSLAKRSMYIEGVLRNLDNMRKYYPPGYTLRVYTDESLAGPYYSYCNMICQNSDLFWCNVRKTPNLGNRTEMVFRTWRFLTLGDPTVETFHIRDLDSMITWRDAAVVADWLQLKPKMPIYVMRDNKGNHNVPVLAGMWGANNTLVKNVIKLRDQIVKESESGKKHKNFDQDTLWKVLFWPRAKQEIVGYDSYHCKHWAKKENMTRPFPIQRRNHETDFVGGGEFARRKYRLKPCPVECRPSYGKDWEYC